MHALYWTVFLLIAVSKNGFVSAGACSASCNCSSETVPLLNSREYFVLRCSDDDISGVANASGADVFYYRASNLTVVMDTNILYRFSNLKYLEIDGGVHSLTFIPPLGSLRIFHLMYASVTYLPNKSLTAISKILVSLSLTFCNVEAIGDDAFAELNKLVTLNLSHNRMEKVYSGLHLSNVEQLDLSFNRIRSISTSDFIGFESLLWLNLDSNDIYSLSYLEFPSSGVALSVKENPLNGLSWRAKSIRKLSSLQLSGNIPNLLKGTFSNAHIDSIAIANCSKLRFIDIQAFINITATNISIINNSQLEFIDPEAFKNINSLENLDLSYNKLHLVPKELSQLADVQQITVLGNPLLCDCNIKWMDTANIEVVMDPTCASDMSLLPSQCSPTLIYRTPNATTIDEGTSTTLQCKVSGLPTPTVVWLYGDRPIPTGTTIQTVNGDLVISESRSKYAGVYECSGKNSEGIVSKLFYLSVRKDNVKIIILKTGKDYVEFSWRTSNQFRRYKAILIDVESNNQTSYAIKQFSRSRHSQSGYVISGLQSETTYSVCLAFENQSWADSEKCETVTTLGETSITSRGITDYTLYGIIIATVVSVLFISIIICVCVTSRTYAARQRKAMREGMVSESSYGLMTTSFSQRSGMSSLYDNPATSITPISHMSRNGSYYKQKRNAGSASDTPTSPTVCFAHDFHVYDESGLFRVLTRTVSDPLITSASDRD